MLLVLFVIGTKSYIHHAEIARRDALVEADSQQLQKIANNMRADYGDNTAITLIDLTNGAQANSNSREQFISASIYKLYVAYGVYQMIDQHKLSLPTTIHARNVHATVDQCLDKMLTLSDNDCAVVLAERYGWANLDRMLHKSGYSHTFLDNYNKDGEVKGDKKTTTEDTAKLLKNLHHNKLLSQSSTQSFLGYLKADEINYMLPAGFAAETTIAHKVGFMDEYQNDAGIIYGKQRNLVAVMFTRGWRNSPPKEASAAFTYLGQQLSAYQTRPVAQ